MRKYFRYLSDKLSVFIMLPDEFINSVVNYRVELKPVGSSDSSYETVYRGSIYYMGYTTIYLNDVIETNMDDFKWFVDRTITTSDNTNRAIKNTYVDAKIVFELNTTEQEYFITDILNGYLSTYMTHETKFDIDSNIPLKSFTDLGYKITPHIPYNTTSWEDEDMHVNFSLPCKVFTSSDVDTFNLQIKNPNNTTIATMSRRGIGAALVGVNINQSVLSRASIDSEGFTVTANYDDTNTTLAVIDYNPAEYYLMWINRMGAIQCQPFCKNNTLTESVSNTYITSLTGESIVGNKTVDYKWTLNSHWLTYDEHGEYESLLVSKYVWLYDTNKGWFYPVNVTDTNWSYKNPNHTKKPFNMTVNLKLAQQQNIIR